MDEKPRRRRWPQFGLVAIFVLLAAAAVVFKFWNPFPQPSRTKFGQIEIGMTEAEVAELVGDPDDVETGPDGRIIHAYTLARDEEWLVIYDKGRVCVSNHFIHLPADPTE
jgi:hypothetical protein